MLPKTKARNNRQYRYAENSAYSMPFNFLIDYWWLRGESDGLPNPTTKACTLFLACVLGLQKQVHRYLVDFVELFN